MVSSTGTPSLYAVRRTSSTLMCPRCSTWGKLCPAGAERLALRSRARTRAFSTMMSKGLVT